MRYLLVYLLLVTFACAQQEPMQSTVPPEYRPPILRDEGEQQALPPSASKLAPDAAVITIKGVCAPAEQGQSQAQCETVITRAQFEKLTDALLTNMKPSRKRQVASAYPGLLAMAQEAEARGLDKSPRFLERLAFARVQILSQELVRRIDEESANVPAKDIEDYYHSHGDAFTTATLERIFIPLRKNMDSPPKDKASAETLEVQRKDAETAMVRLADVLHSKAVAGEDFLALQKEAYIAAGLTDVPPNPSLGQVRLSGLPPQHAAAFNLNPGDVSQVISDSTGHYIYKLDTKKIEALTDASDGIRKILQTQRREEAIQAVQKPVTTELNPAYFGTPEKRSGPQDPKSK
jgi:PPIC-type PPIASE domain